MLRIKQAIKFTLNNSYVGKSKKIKLLSVEHVNAQEEFISCSYPTCSELVYTLEQSDKCWLDAYLLRA